MPDKVVHLNLRLPPELHERLTVWARAEHRSLHGHALHILTEAVDREASRTEQQTKASPAD